MLPVLASPALAAGALGAALPPPCLCIFDVDRTLTAQQGSAGRCAGTEEQGGVVDTAYGGGTLILSDLAVNLHTTICAACRFAIISAGPAGGEGSLERTALWRVLGGGAKAGTMPAWTAWPNRDGRSPFVVTAPEGRKQEAVPGILRWYERAAAGGGSVMGAR